MSTFNYEIIEHLDETDQEKIKYFMKLLLEQIKYKEIKRQIAARRREISTGNTLSHADIWNTLDV